MTDYKLVPIDPTPEMVEAAEDAYMPFGDMELALRMAILAAPAVQGEPVGYIRKSALELMEGDELGVRANIIKEPRYQDCVALYTAPQPAAHQPCPEGVREGAPYDDPAFSALCREHEVYGTAAAAQCAVFWEAGKRVAEQQTAPDVAGLAEALERISKRASVAECKQVPCSPIQRLFVDIMQQADDALAAYRKGGEV